MSFFLYISVLILVLAGLTALFLKMDARRLATTLRYALPSVVTIIGVVLALAGRMGIAMGFFGLAVLLLRRARSHTRGTKSRNQASHVRTAALEMELDLDTGAMNGLVLAGKFEGRTLQDMDEAELALLYRDLQQDVESVQVLEAYLNWRSPAWRDSFDTDSDSGLGAAPASGPMTKEEAYQVLGLAAGATESEIREAHRRLMKRVHPDTGGSVFLATRINEAKDVLLRGH